VLDTVSIRIPALPAYVQVVRLVAAGLASRLRFTLDDIEDLKIGVDELASYVIGTQGRAGTLEIRFALLEDGLEVHGEGHLTSDSHIRTELSEFSRVILDGVADSASLQQLDGVPTFELVKKRT
jgi:serine/threonine-protein kinase RsbW